MDSSGREVDGVECLPFGSGVSRSPERGPPGDSLRLGRGKWKEVIGKDLPTGSDEFN